LAGLRKRLANLFLQFVTTPEFNPEASNFQKVPSEVIAEAKDEEEEFSGTTISTAQSSDNYPSAAAAKEKELPTF